jgi:very-short-patch-repair endonuclease
MTFTKIVNISKHTHGADKNIKGKARILRKKMTEAEEVLWLKLRRKQIKGLHFRRQHPYGMFILDFYCDKANLAIEVDGNIHDYRKEYDLERDAFIKQSGINVVRFTNNEVINNPENVVEKIKAIISNLHPITPSPVGEGWEGGLINQ